MITSFDKYSIMDCVEDCLRTTRCRSINYYQGAHFCQTNFENRTTVPELYIAKPGWIYTDIEDWDKKIAGACSRSSCRINEKCIPQPFDQFTCVISDCGVPKGDSYSMEHVREWDAIGISRGIHITCADKHNQLGSERFVCRSNGTWRADLSCPEKYNECDGNWMSYKGHYYILNQTKLSQPDAMSECKKCDSFLVEIDDEGENKWIEEHLLKDRGVPQNGFVMHAMHCWISMAEYSSNMALMNVRHEQRAF
uniref:Apple domain-containing protein n=1 Tax=Magallana gigas TaxID=29159 RepID=A0A8W8NY41_MAGGI